MGKSHRITFHVQSPISHGAFDAIGGGNATALRRFPVLLNGEQIFVPGVSGNSLRGTCRRLLMREMFDELGMDHTLDHFDSTIDPEFIRGVRLACPPLSLFGAGMKTWFLPGRMSVGICWPVCDVTISASLATAEDEDAVPVLSDIESEIWHSRLPDNDHHNPEQTGMKPMPHGSEVINTGVSLQSEIYFTSGTTAVERSAMARALELVNSLGGKVGIGMGRVKHGGMDVDTQPYLDWLGSEDARESVKEVLLR